MHDSASGWTVTYTRRNLLFIKNEWLRHQVFIVRPRWCFASACVAISVQRCHRGRPLYACFAIQNSSYSDTASKPEAESRKQYTNEACMPWKPDLVPSRWRGVLLACGRGCRLASVIRACPRSTPRWVYLVWYVVCCPYFHRCLCCWTKSLIPAFPGRHKALVVQNFLWWMRGRKVALVHSTLGSIPFKVSPVKLSPADLIFIDYLGEFTNIIWVGESHYFGCTASAMLLWSNTVLILSAQCDVGF